MLEAVTILMQAIEALQAAAIANKFMIPFALAGRLPTDLEIEAEFLRLTDLDADPRHMLLFVGLCEEMRNEANLVRHLPGRA